MDPYDLVDDVVYYGITSAVAESTGLPQIVNNVMPSGIVDGKIKAALISGLILEASTQMGNKLDTFDKFGYLRHLGSKLKNNFSSVVGS